MLTRSTWVLLLIFALAIMVRFYNFSNRVTFGPEQAISMEASAEMIKNKFSLLGIENVQRTTSQGLKIYSGALFSYSLIPLLIIFNYKILPISLFFTILNILTGYILYILVKKSIDQKIAILSTFLFLFNAYMIYHSLFLWILDYLPLIGILVLYFLYKLKKVFNIWEVIYLGFLSGAGVSLEYLFLPTYILILGFCIYFSKKRLKTLLIFLLASAIPNLPLMIFDLKHDFYNIHVLWFYFQDVINRHATSGIMYYDFLQFLPFVIIILSVLLVKLWNTNKIFAIFAVIIYLYFNLNSSLVNFKKPTGMPKDLTVDNIEMTASIISENNPKNFNVAVINDFDTRGHILRYPLEFNYNIYPDAVENYPNDSTLYVLSPIDYQFSKSKTWELQSFNLEKPIKIANIGNSFGLFKLEK